MLCQQPLLCYTWAMNERLIPDTHYLSVPDLTAYIVDKTSHVQNASRCVNQLILKQIRSSVNPGEYAPLFRRMFSGQIPSNRVEANDLYRSELVIDALAVWAIATENLVGSSKWRNPAHIENLGQKTMGLLVGATENAINWQVIGDVPTPSEICVVYKINELSS